MNKNCIGRPHVIRSNKLGTDIISSPMAMHNYVKCNVYKILKGKKCQFLDDIIGDTFVEILEYSKKFKKCKNITPETFINLRLRGSIVDNYVKYLQTVRTPRRRVNFNSYDSKIDKGKFFSNSFYNSVNPSSFGDQSEENYNEDEIDKDFQTQTPDEYIDQYDIRKMKIKIIDFVRNNLKKSDQEIFQMRFIKNMTLKEIGKEMNKTFQSINEREKIIMRKIRLNFPQNLSLLNI